MSNAADVDKELTWSTWEELLLAFAVKRHGLKDWDTVAMELRNRHRGGSSSLPPTSLTAQICKNKYRNLRRRFTDHHDTNTNTNTTSAGGGGGGSENDDDDDEKDGVDGGGGGESDSDSFLWLEELRKLRVAELKEEVHRYDLSIRTSQMKVKTMEEERERSLRGEEEDQNDDVKQPDLDEELTEEKRSENDKNDDKGTPEDVNGKPVSRHDDDENMSFNESNSTENRRIGLQTEPDSEPAEVKSESESKPVGQEVSCNDSSASQEREKGGGDSGELRDSVGDGESKEGTKESSDVQSSASLLMRKKKRRGVDGGGGEGGGGDGAAVVSPTTAAAPIKREDGEGGAVKSEPSVAGFLDKIRSHKHGSVFERRLQSQKTEKYKSTIRQHVDLETVQTRIDDGSYSSCSTKFYVDLLLLFTNAIVFFPKSSPESLAAKELRQLVLKELKKDSFDPSPESISGRPKPKPELERSNSLLAQHKSTNPAIVSRKRSSISAKASSSSAKSVEKQQTDDKPVIDSKTFIKSPLSTSNDEQDSAKLKIKEKPVTGIRSMRRSSKGRPNMSKPEPTPNSSNNKGSSSQQPSSKDKGNKVPAAKGDKKKSHATPSTKKSGAADFLKRIKKTSPAKETLVESLKSTGKNSSKGGKKDQPKKKLDERKDGPVRRSGSGGGGGNRKHAKEESSSSKKSAGRSLKKEKDKVVSGKKRGREGGEGEGSSKRPKKRSR